MKSLKNKIKKVLLVLSMLIVLATSILAFFKYRSQNIMSWDYPRNLSSEIDTIEISYISWACDCANWLPLPNNETDVEKLEDACIFIEPVNRDLEIPDSFWKGEYLQKKLRLVGSYYKNEGVPKDYIMETEVKPDKAKVFRYSKVEILGK